MPDPIVAIATETPATLAATPAPAAEPRSPETFSREERRDWLSTGKVPNTTPAAIETDEEPPAAVAGTPAPAGPDLSRWVKTPPPAGVSKRQHERNELIRHATETEQRLRDLETQLQARSAPAGPAKTEPPVATPPGQEYDGSDPSDPRPTIEQFADDPDPYARQIREEIKWEQRKEQRVAQHAEQRTTAERSTAERTQKYVERAQEYAKTRPEFAAKTATVRANVHPQSPMAAWLMESPVSPQILEHLADHPEDFTRIARATSFEAAHAAFVRLEARFESSPQSTPAADPPASPALTPKLVSSAPPPPPTLGTRPAESADEEKAAVARDDFRAYKAAADRKEHARRRGQ